MSIVWTLITFFGIIFLVACYGTWRESKISKVEACDDPGSYLGEAGYLD